MIKDTLLVKRNVFKGGILFLILVITVFLIAAYITVTTEDATFSALSLFNRELEEPWRDLATELNSYCEAAGIVQNPELSVRDIFSPVVEQTLRFPFRLLSTSYTPLTFMYKGFIERSNGVFIAQINTDGKTYFLQQGELLEEWQIEEITKKEVVIVNAEGERLSLILHKQTFSTKPYALFSVQGKEKRVEIGERVEGYKILDITEDSVILSYNSEVFTIRK